MGLKHGVGACIYLRSIYNPFEVVQGHIGFSDPSIETVWCSCSISKEKLLNVYIYRSGYASEKADKQIN